MNGFEVVIALRPPDRAKSRLALEPEHREALAVAMATDTVVAALDSDFVRSVSLVCPDERLRQWLTHLPVAVLTGEPVGDLNSALRYAAAFVRRAGSAPVALMSADLPAATGPAISTVLDVARFHPCVVPDAAGTGTTMLALPSECQAIPQFGLSSLQHHQQAGAIVLAAPGLEGLRTDVDTVEDLRAAADIGLGEQTRAVLDRLLEKSDTARQLDLLSCSPRRPRAPDISSWGRSARPATADL